MPHSLTDTMRTSPAPAEAAAVSLRGGRKKKLLTFLHRLHPVPHDQAVVLLVIDAPR